MKSFIKNQKGVILLMTILIMSGILTVAYAASDMVIPSIIMGRGQARSIKAYYAAETGAERVLAVARNSEHGFDFTACEVGSYLDFANKNCSVSYVQQSMDGQSDYYYYVLIKNINKSGNSVLSGKFSSVGSYKSTKRVIEISY